MKFKVVFSIFMLTIVSANATQVYRSGQMKLPMYQSGKKMMMDPYGGSGAAGTGYGYTSPSKMLMKYGRKDNQISYDQQQPKNYDEYSQQKSNEGKLVWNLNFLG